MSTMKSLCFLPGIGLLLVACAVGDGVDMANSNSLEEVGIEFGEDCPYGCWLGIRPGYTEQGLAITILETEQQINDEELFQVSDEKIDTIWFTDSSQTFSSPVRLEIQANLIESIHFDHLTPIRVDDFIRVLGEPDKIVIALDETIDGGTLVYYAMYFSVKKVTISVYPGNSSGPHPKDFVRSLTLNETFTVSQFFEDVESQPWLGYGRLDEYLHIDQ